MERGVRGIGFFDDKAAFWNALSGDLFLTWRSVHRVWSLIYGSIAMLPMSEASWVDQGLDVANPHAYPLAKNVQTADKVKRPSPKILEFLTGLLVALAETTTDELDEGRWSRVVNHEGVTQI
jgi:hypothetical protein